ncbi:MAG: type transport system ATP-binding protein [Miltoncostaeaceae bacterium]|jgi:ABC-2 type transport system ATP-binding protein|nr:type transport system ATP-binding protein [Miltoncostaeaceae bacterium]
MIEVEGLTKRFGNKLAVDDLTFSVRPGMVTGFLGPNGAGKSTTMRMILGLDRPTAGTALVGGRPYDVVSGPMHEVGALLDAKDVHGGRTARNHLRALAQSNGLPRARVDEVLEIAGITSVAKKRIKGFSLGMNQRLGIAAALLGDPEVLMFDEPVNGLDPEGIQWIRNLMRRLASEGRTVFVSSHLMSEMAQTADHLIVIGRGRLIADLSVADFIRKSSSNHVKVRSPQGDRLAELLTARGVTTSADNGYLLVQNLDTASVGDLAAENRITIHELFEEKATLEAAFMELTRDSVEYQAGAPGAATAGEAR